MLVELKNVAKRYESPDDGPEMDVLKGVDLVVDSGQSLAIIGPSGSGKSTLLNIIGALDKADSGQVLLDGKDLSGLDEKALARIRNRQIGFIFQLHHLLPQLTVMENVLVPTLALHNADQSADLPAHAESLLRRVGLAEWMHYRPGQLSGGQRQRVAVVRALINQPRLLLADEPTGSLDQTSADNIADLLADLNRTDGLTLIVVTHSARLADKMNRTCHLTDGMLHEETET
ncbi:MAG: ABC transporter ATP-binding protein [Sedimentisphaerales bacterium]|nr:ABC transporter ATP-binding protein [Sedimentisphaerales bacterium]